MFNCKCGKEYKNKRSLRKHELKSDCINNRGLSVRETYETSPKTCIHCEKVIPYEKRENNFCNSSCSASYNNKKTKKKDKRKCLYCNIETDNPKFCSGNCSVNFIKAQKIKNILNGSASSLVCKKYLIEKHGNICLDKNCAWDFSKESVNVELEHIDGDSTNNNLTNLTLLCPNCHSKTATYKSKNNGKSTRSYRMKRYYEGKSY